MELDYPPAQSGYDVLVLALTTVLILGTVTLGYSMPVGATNGDDPRFEVFVPESTLTPGETVRTTIQLVNDHHEVDRSVLTARNVAVTVTSGDTPIQVTSGTRLLGEMADGVVREIAVRVHVPGDIPSGTYELPVRLSYEFGADERDTTTVPATVQVPDRPRFSVVATDAPISVGETGTVNVTFENVGSAVANDAVVTVESMSSEVSFGQSPTATRFVGTWRPGERRTVAYDVSVAPSAQTGQYALEARVTYRDADGAMGTAAPVRIGLAPNPEQRFSLGNVTSTLHVGDTGTLSGVLVNDGNAPVHEAVIVFTTEGPALTPAASEYAVGRLEPGDRVPFAIDIAVSPQASPGPRRFSFVVEYRDRQDDRQTSREITTIAQVGPRLFSVEDVTSTLRVGAEGTLSVTIVNTGDRTVRNAVVLFEPETPNVNPIETEYAVGDLAPGERADFTFDVEVSDAAGAGPRQFSVAVRYRDAIDQVTRSGPIDVQATVHPRRNTFEVTPVDGAVAAGGSATLTVRVTNAADEPLTDVSAKLFTNDPLSSDDDEAFIDRLEPGESTDIRFNVRAGSGTLAKAYPVSIDFQYDDADGDTLLSDTYKVPVTVTRQSGRGLAGPIIALIVGLVAIAGAAYYLYRRR